MRLYGIIEATFLSAAFLLAGDRQINFQAAYPNHTHKNVTQMVLARSHSELSMITRINRLINPDYSNQDTRRIVNIATLWIVDMMPCSE